MMVDASYKTFYDVPHPPFGPGLDPQFLYLPQSHRAALDLLKRGVQQRCPIMMLIGDVGTGKTTLVHVLRYQLRERVEVARTGVASVALAVDRRGGLVGEPSVSLRGIGGTDGDSTLRAVKLEVARTVERLRKRFVEEGLETALNERRRPGGKPKLDGRQEACLIALACSAAPHRRQRWTMQLLTDRVVERGLVPSISDDTVRRALKKTPSNRG